MTVGSGRSALNDRRAAALICSLLSGGVVAGQMLNRGFFLRDDFLNYYLGAYAEIARALAAGELPLLTLTSWQAGALAGEYQLGVFSPPLTALSVLLFGLDLPLQNVAAALVWAHALILGFGAYALARRRRLSPELSLMVALASSLNGWMVFWGVNWFAALAAFAWLPWFWWALERAVARRGEARSVVAAGVFLALVVTAGFPYACLMAALVAFSAVARLAADRRPSAEALPVLWSLLLGLALSAPAWLMLLEYSPATLRAHTSPALVPQADLTVPLKAWLGSVLPTLHAPWRAPWLPPDDTPSLAMHAGLAPVALLVAALVARRSKLVAELRLDFLFLALLVVLASSPGLGVLRWSFRWMPLVFLQAALVAGAAAHASPARSGPGKIAWLLVAAVSAWAVLVDGVEDAAGLGVVVGLLTVASIWWRLERLPALARQMPWAAVALSSFLTFGICLDGNLADDRRRSIDHSPPAFDPSVTYLALYTPKDAFADPLLHPGQRYFPGNQHMHSALRFVNGYSPLGPAGTTSAFGFNYIGAIAADEPYSSRPLGPLLRRMAVDGLVVWPGSRELRNISYEEFEPSAEIPGAVVYLRRGAPTPRVQTVRRAFLARGSQLSTLPLLEPLGRDVEKPGPVSFGEAKIVELDEGRHEVRVAVDARGTDRPVLLSFARPWFPGYHGLVDGEPVELFLLDRILPAVEVPAGRQSEVILVYRPASLVAGIFLSALAVAGSLSGLGLAARRRRRG